MEKTVLNPKIIAKSVARRMDITEKKEFIPKHHGTKPFSPLFTVESPWGKGTPMKNPRGAIINSTITTLIPIGKVIDKENKKSIKNA